MSSIYASVSVWFFRSRTHSRCPFTDNIAYGPRIHGLTNRKQLGEIVERTLRGSALWDEVKDKLKASAFALSGGQQQRLCIARTLAVEPEVILMDEPCSALDPNSTFRIEQLIEDLKKDYTIIIVTHNMQQAARVSQRTGFFLRGEMKEFGDTDQIFTNPKDKDNRSLCFGPVWMTRWARAAGETEQTLHTLPTPSRNAAAPT